MSRSHLYEVDNKPVDIASLTILFILFIYIGLSVYIDIFSSALGLYDEKRVEQLVLITAVLLVVLISGTLRKDISKAISTPPFFLRFGLYSLAILGFFSAYKAPIPIYAYAEYYHFLGLILLSLAVAIVSWKYPKVTFYSISASIWCFMIVYEVEFITNYVAAWVVNHYLGFSFIFPNFSNVRFFNQAHIWMLPFALAPLILHTNINRKQIFFIYLVSSIWIMILLASQSRGALLATLVSITLTYAIYQKKAQKLVKVALRSGGIAVILYIVFFVATPKLFTHLFDTPNVNFSAKVVGEGSLQDRIELWVNSIQYIYSSPFLGVGPMHYAYYPNSHAHPHNSLLQIAAEFGLVFTVITIMLMVYFAYCWIERASPLGQNHLPLSQTDNKREMKLNIILSWSFLSGLAYSMVSGVIVMPFSQTMMAVVIGLMLGSLIRMTTINKAPAPHPIHTYTIQLIFGGALIGIAYNVTPHFTTRVLAPFFGSYLPTHTIGPRYWELGGLIQEPSRLTTYYSDPRLAN